MKKNITSLIFAIGGLFISSTSWSQCPTIACPSDTTIYNVSNNCSAVFTYPMPVGSDPCELVADTFQYSGAITTWTVPAGITSITVESRGAAGGYTTASGVQAGLGAIVKGDLTVTPGQILYILVGQNNNAGNGGGGGTYVVDATNAPLMIAGGGGGAGGSVDSAEKHGKVGTTGGTGAGGGGTGGTAGNGGNIGASFAAGAGGGLLTDGATGWTTNTAGLAYVNGGAGGTAGWGLGGFGGGGNGSGNQVGGGGGGYSGGGAGSNSAGPGVGGGGASYNAGTNQVNTGGVNAGNGLVIITYGGATTTTLASGIGSGNEFPIGTSTESFMTINSMGDSAFCSFNVTVIDTLTVPASLGSFGQDSICVYNNPIALPVGSPAGGTYSGNGVNGTNFDPSIAGVGSHTVTYTVIDSITGCTTDAMSSIYVDGCAGLNDVAAPNSLSIYPNPNNGSFTVSFENVTNELTTIEVSDLNGRLVYSSSSSETHISQSIDIRNESSGIYLLKISSDSHSYAHKIVKD